MAILAMAAIPVRTATYAQATGSPVVYAMAKSVYHVPTQQWIYL